LPEISLADRKVHLTKYEVLLLNSDQVEEFNSKFSAGVMESTEPLYQAWLVLKLSTLTTESEALIQVLGNHTATNIPKRVTKRKSVLPDGPPRYDPSSPEWVKILQDRENKETGQTKKRKVPEPKVSKAKSQPKVSKPSVKQPSKKKKPMDETPAKAKKNVKGTLRV
jgi:hypothetical protein